MKFFFTFILSLVACAYLRINPVLPIFVVIGVNLYLLRRNSPQLHNPANSSEASDFRIPSANGIYLERADFVAPDRSSHSGGHLRDGVDPNIPANEL